MTGPAKSVPVIDNAADLLSTYDVVFCDVWGVVHNGVRPYAAAVDALKRFRAKGGAVVLVTNSPVAGEKTADFLVRVIGVPRDAWDTIITSGDLTRGYLTKHALKHIHHIGSARDLSVFGGLGVERVAIEQAQAVVCTGVADDTTETGETYRPLLEVARGRDLPFVCGNPDLVVEVDGVLYPCAGAVATIYEDMGGEVYWAGKPHEPTYVGAQRLAEQHLDRSIDRAKIIGIGDAVRTDMAGAASFGIDGLFIAHGIHREELMPNGNLDPRVLGDLFAAGHERLPVAAMSGLVW